ncbi:MAG TPA: hypothetical protein VKR21_06355 [Solirubrobacteraceae bacterium]|nr:hypothetical protein [Solirubrobacteraceae bacterium]
MTLTIARQMFIAELLKLRRQRAVMAVGTFLSVGVVVIFMGYLQLRHASNPAKYGPAGGLEAFKHLLRALGYFFGVLLATLIGAEAGTTDASSGVFRDLVATGRSRLALFFVRVPAAVALTLALSAVAYGLGVLATFAFAGGRPTPSVSLVLQGAGWIALADVAMSTLAVGIGALTGSRAVTLISLVGLQAIVTPLLVNVGSLGAARDVLLNPALGQLVPYGGGLGVAMATGVAVAVVVGWTAIPAAIGAWRTNTRDA